MLTWTVTDARTLRDCERQYYYRAVAGRAGDHQAAVLGRFVTVASWVESLARGVILDEMIGNVPPVDRVLLEAKMRFEWQLEAALRNDARKERDPAAPGLIRVDRGGTLTRRQQEAAWSWVVRRVRAHHRRSDALGSLVGAVVRREAGVLLRPDVRVSSTPDLLLPLENGSAVVEVSGADTRTARARLGVAALVAGASRRVHWRWGRATDVPSMPAGTFRKRILWSADQMMLVEARAGPLYARITSNVATCERCPYYSLCGRQAPKGRA